MRKLGRLIGNPGWLIWKLGRLVQSFFRDPIWENGYDMLRRLESRILGY
jgi:hypothetical protein